MADGKKKAKTTGVAELISEAWFESDYAATNVSMAAKALETLRTQVVSGVLDLSGVTNCDMDTFYVYVEGILATMREAENEARRASKRLTKVKKSGPLQTLEPSE